MFFSPTSQEAHGFPDPGIFQQESSLDLVFRSALGCYLDSRFPGSYLSCRRWLIVGDIVDLITQLRVSPCCSLKFGLDGLSTFQPPWLPFNPRLVEAVRTAVALTPWRWK